jgi:hypothetical protein
MPCAGSGELHHAIVAGLVSADDIHAELGLHIPADRIWDLVCPK